MYYGVGLNDDAGSGFSYDTLTTATRCREEFGGSGLMA
jgi:hypothetical protein